MIKKRPSGGSIQLLGKCRYVFLIQSSAVGPKLTRHIFASFENRVRNLSPSTNPHDYFGTGAPTKVKQTSKRYAMESQIFKDCVDDGSKPTLTDEERLEMLYSKEYMPSYLVQECLQPIQLLREEPCVQEEV